jgi:hypothetical protein
MFDARLVACRTISRACARWRTLWTCRACTRWRTDDWLVDAVARGVVLKDLHIWLFERYRNHPQGALHRVDRVTNSGGSAGHLHAAKHDAKRAEAARDFARWMELARSHDLKRFAEAAEKRMEQLNESDARLVLTAELREAIKKLNKSREGRREDVVRCAEGGLRGS